MTKKFCISVIFLLTVIILFNACVLEYDFEREAPWTRGAVPITMRNVSGTAQGWGGPVVVTLDLAAGNIQNVRIEGRGETPSHTRELIQAARMNAQIFNTFDFLDGMTGATVTRNAIRDAGRGALRAAGANL